MSKTLETRKYEKGNITIEATIALTTFLFMFIMIYSLITICRVQAKIQVALDGTAKEISQYTYLYNITGLKTSVDGVHSRSKEIEDNVNGFVGDVSTTLDGIQTLKEDVGGSIDVGNLEELNGKFEKISTDLKKTGEDAKGVKDTVQQALGELSDNPQKLMLGLGTVLASNTLDLATSRMASCRLKEVRKICHKLCIIAFTGVLIIPSITSISTIKDTYKKGMLISKALDSDMVEVVKRENPQRIYNDYNYGETLIYNDIKVFVDARADLYITDNLLRDAIALMQITTTDSVNLEFNAEDMISKYDFDGFILEKTRPLYTLYTYLRSHQDRYILVAENGKSGYFKTVK